MIYQTKLNLLVIFADDRALIYQISDKQSSRDKLNNDLQKVNEYPFKGRCVLIRILQSRLTRCTFHFSKKSQKQWLSSLIFNGSNVESCSFQKQLGFTFDEKFNFDEHLQFSFLNVIGYRYSKKLSTTLSLNVLLTIYKSSVRPQLGCGHYIW